MKFERTKEFLMWEWCGRCANNCFPQMRKELWTGETYEHYVCNSFEWSKKWPSKSFALLQSIF